MIPSGTTPAARGGAAQLGAALGRLVDPLDGLRRAFFVGAQRVPVLGPVVARRDLRLMAQTSLGVSTTFALTLLAPGVLFVVGPALFGVAHLAGDIRYLLLRRGVPWAWAAIVVVASVLLSGSRMLEAASPELLPFARIEVLVGWGWALVGGAVGALSARRPARILLVCPALLLVLVEALAQPELARALFSYGHNVIAIGLWALLFRRRVRFALPALLLAGAGAVALATARALPWANLGGPWGGTLVEEALWSLSPPLGQRAAVGLGLSYVFLQAIHYAVWLSWVPQEDLPVEGTTSFRMSLRSMRRDFGGWGLGLVVAAAALVLGASLLSPHRTRHLYLSVAAFHGYLEVAALAFLLGRGGLGAARGRGDGGSAA
jgi:hypothetical protein